MKRVVVTGLGALSPLGHSVKENWDALMASKSGVGKITLFDASTFSSQIAGEVRGFQPEKHFPVKELKRIDRFIQLALVAGSEAFESSGLKDKYEASRAGSCIGVGIGGLAEIQAQYKDFLEKGARRISPFFIPAVIGNLAAGHLSIRYGLKGPSTCITTACSSSAHAIGESYRLIQRGDQDVMFAGGAEAVVCELGVGGFCSMRALSTRNEAPEKASRPFDKDRDGFVIAEGAAVVVLEELEHAKKRGAQIHGEIVGYALNADAFHITQPTPEGPQGCMALALKDAKLNPEQIDYINAHGTSTPIGDINETLAVKGVFRDHAKKLCMSSTKSMTGHLLGAAGALEGLYTMLALKHQVAPPTINLENPSPECDLNYVPNEPQTRKMTYALSNSFGFGGTNGSLIFKKFEG